MSSYTFVTHYLNCRRQIYLYVQNSVPNYLAGNSE